MDRFFGLSLWRRKLARLKIPPVLFLSLVFFSVTPSRCLADQKNGGGLFNARALNRADARKESGKSRGRLEQGPKSDYSESIFNAARVDTVDDVLLFPERDRGILGEFHGLSFLSRVGGNLDVGDIDESKSRALAGKLAIYQFSNSFERWVKGTDLERTYEGFIDGIKAARNATSFQLRQSGEGQLRVSQEQKAGQLLQFSLHASMRNGLQPELKLTDNIAFRYDIFQSDTMLEYRLDF